MDGDSRRDYSGQPAHRRSAAAVEVGTFSVDLTSGEVRFGDGTEIGGIGLGAGSLRLVPERYGIFGKQAVTRICTAGCAARARLE